MNIEEMTTEQIEAYLQERKAPRKGELGGILKRADEVELGETAWLKCAKKGTGNIAALFVYEFENGSDDIRIYNQTLVETNVPTPAPARRRLTAAEAAEQLEVGQAVWVKCSIIERDELDKLPLKLSVINTEFVVETWLKSSAQIEVDA